MIWVGWRQQRTETAIAAAMLVLLAALLVPSGLSMANAYHHDHLSSCLGVITSPSCGDAVGSFTSRFNTLVDLVSWLNLVPGLVGVLLAAPLVLDLENGTYRLAWTQSISRRRWLAGKLGLEVGAALIVALALIVLLTWWRQPFVHLDGRMDTGAFDSQGTVILGYTLFALGLATALGVLWRRAVPALLVAFGVYFASRLFVDGWLRQRLLTPSSGTWRNTGAPPAILQHAWVLRASFVGQLGHAGRVAQICHGGKCRAQIGEGLMHAVFFPTSRFWALQGIETALFGGVALVLLALAAWWTHERVA